MALDIGLFNPCMPQPPGFGFGEPFRMSRESKGTPTSVGSKEPIAPAPVLARWLGISGKAVYELTKAGVLVHASHNHFLLEESVRRYCDYIRRTASQRNTDAAEQAMQHEPVKSGGGIAPQ